MNPFFLMKTGQALVQNTHFTTTKSTGTASFTMTPVDSGDPITVDWGDGTVTQYTANPITHTYSTGGTKNIKVTEGQAQITSMTVNSANLTSMSNMADFTSLNSLTSRFNDYTILDIDNNTITYLDLFDNNSLTDLRIDTCTALHSIYVWGCGALDTIGSVSTPVGTADLSTMSSANFRIANFDACALIQHIEFPSSVTYTGSITLLFDGCTTLASDNADPLDISMMGSSSGITIDFNNNHLLEEIYVGTNTKVTRLDSNNCAALSRINTGATAAGYADCSNFAAITYCFLRNAESIVEIDLTGSATLGIVDMFSSVLLARVFFTSTALTQIVLSSCPALDKVGGTGTAAATAATTGLTSLVRFELWGNSIIKTIGIPNAAVDANWQFNNMSLTAAQMDTILGDIWAVRNTVVSTPELAILPSNTAPNGTYGAQCPPVTGQEFLYELRNDSCAEGFQKWTIT